MAATCTSHKKHARGPNNQVAADLRLRPLGLQDQVFHVFSQPDLVEKALEISPFSRRNALRLTNMLFIAHLSFIS